MSAASFGSRQMKIVDPEEMSAGARIGIPK